MRASRAAEPAPDPADLVRQWIDAAQAWTRWWMHAAPQPAAGEPRAPLAAPPLAVVDGRELAALDAKYRPSFEALWAAARALPLDAQEARLPRIVESDPAERRFSAREWDELPFFSLMKQAYLLGSRYVDELAAIVRAAPADRRRVAFMMRQCADSLAPTNHPATNPEVLARAIATRGESLARGMANLVDDYRRGRITMSDASAFAVGRNLAVTPGHVVFRNELIELIQYAPTTPRVHRRPTLIVPPCINKYYILDLQPSNSFVRWAVARGHTVFMISWRNPGPELGRLGWDDYLESGVFAALDATREIAGSATVNALGYCVGGTLLACALAVLAARGKRRVESASFFTTMLDFEEPGDIGVYVTREFLASRERELMAGGRVRGAELAGAFASLRANELVWHYVVRNYLKGETPPPSDLLHWNGDSANLPGPMYVYYLRNLYLDNRLREPGALTMAGERVDLRRIGPPAYVYASRDDHIVPWRSAYRTARLLGGETTFVLGASGHIAGVVNPPEANRRNYWTNPNVGESPDAWLAGAQSAAGSWWPHWEAWLSRHAGSEKRAPARAGSDAHPPLDAAPGRYVHQHPD